MESIFAIRQSQGVSTSLSLTRGESIRCVRVGDPEYAQVLDLVREKYWSKLHAVNDAARAEYAVLCNEVDAVSVSITACVAVQRPSPNSLFSEQYLDAPAETSISRRLGEAVARTAIVELGSLASCGPSGSATKLLRYLPLLLREEGAYTHVLCTATDYVQRIMRSAGYDFIGLCAAAPDRVSAEELPKWGSYYSHHPVTGFFELATPAMKAATALLRHLRLEVTT